MDAEGAWIVWLIFGGVALFALLFTPIDWLVYQRLASRGGQAAAEVVDADTEESYTIDRNGVGGYETEHYVKLRFTTSDERLFGVRLRVPKALEPGTGMPIIYDPDDPTRVRIFRSRGYWVRNAISGVIGFVVFAIIGGAILWGMGAIDVG